MLRPSIRTVINRDWQRQVLNPALSRLVADIAEMVAAGVRENISTSGPPRSRPGEYPHVDKGDLLASIRTRRSESAGAAGLSYDIIADAPHAPIVERTRPFLTRSLDELAAQIRAVVKRGGK